MNLITSQKDLDKKKELVLVCKDYERFPESGRMRAAARELNIPTFDSHDCWDENTRTYFKGNKYSNFHYGTCGFFLRYNLYDIFSGQEYLYDFSFLLSILDNEVIFNGDALIAPAGQFNLYKHSFGDELFIKPNNGYKSFAGTTLVGDELEKNLQYYFNIAPWELVVLSSIKPQPEAEYRFFCIKQDNDEVLIEGCRYLPDRNIEVPENVRKFALKTAERIFDVMTIGNSFVLDLAVSGTDIKVMELNSWNSSSYYCINPEKLLLMIRKCYC